MAEEGVTRLQLGTFFELYSLPDEWCLRLKKQADDFGVTIDSIFTAHQMGGCRMTHDPSSRVVGTDHRVEGFENLYVVDGSVLPTSLGVNPSETIYALAHRAVEPVAG